MASNDVGRIRRNIEKMKAQGAPETDVLMYINSEGYSPRDVGYKAKGSPAPMGDSAAFVPGGRVGGVPIAQKEPRDYSEVDPLGEAMKFAPALGATAMSMAAPFASIPARVALAATGGMGAATGQTGLRRDGGGVHLRPTAGSGSRGASVSLE